MPRPALAAAELRARQGSVRGLLDQVAREVAALPAPVLRELAPVLRAAQAELERDLRGWLARTNGDERFTAQQYRRALAQIDTALDEVGKLEPALVASLGHAAARSGALAASHVKHELAVFSSVFEGTVSPVPLNLAALVARGQKLLIPRHKTSAARYVGHVRDDIRRQLALGLVRGETIHQLTTRLARGGGPRGLVALRGIAGQPGAYVEHIAEGLFGRYRYWGERVARTEVIHGYNVQAHLALEEVHRVDARIQRRWDASLDSRICPACRELDHVVVDVDKPFPGGVDAPPAHPNCRCAVVAWRSDWDTKGTKGSAPAPAPSPPSAPLPAPPPPLPVAVSTAPPSAATLGAGGTPSYSLPDLLKALQSPTGAAEQKVIREQLNKIVEEPGYDLVLQAVGKAKYDYKLRPVSAMGTSLGLFDPTTGEIQVLDTWHTKAADGVAALVAARTVTDEQISAVKTLVHETVHAHSPLTIYIATHKYGRVVEEVTTEVTARKIVRETFSLKSKVLEFPKAATDTGSYNWWIHPMVDILESELGLKRAQVHAAIEEAGITMRRHKGALISTSDAYAKHFVANLPISDAVALKQVPSAKTAKDAQALLRDRIVSKIKSEPW